MKFSNFRDEIILEDVREVFLTTSLFCKIPLMPVLLDATTDLEDVRSRGREGEAPLTPTCTPKPISLD
jgi:hypothetical protein